MAKGSGLLTKPAAAAGYGLEKFGSDGDATGYQPFGKENSGETDDQTRDRVLLSVDCLELPELSPRTVYTDDMVEQRARSLEDIGQQEDIKVRPKPGSPGIYLVIEGWTRVLATRKSGKRELWGVIRSDLNDIEAAWLGFHHNEQRAAHTDLDRGLFFAKLIAAGGADSQSDLAEKSGIDRQIVQRLVSFAKLSPALQDLCRDHADYFTYNLGYQLSRLQDKLGKKGDDTALKFAQVAVRKKYTQKQFIAEVERMMGEKEKPKAIQPLAERQYEGGVLRRFENRVEFSLKCSGDKAERLMAQIEALLAASDD